MFVWWLLLVALSVGAAFSVVLILVQYRRARIVGPGATLHLPESWIIPVPGHAVTEGPPLLATDAELVAIERELTAEYEAPLAPAPRRALSHLVFPTRRYHSSIVFCTTCRNRTQHLRVTLPRNMADNPKSKFVVLNYSSEDNLLEWIFSAMGHEIDKGRLVVYSVLGEPVFRMAHAKNMGMRCAMLEEARILVTVDADNFTGPGFEDFIESWFHRDHNIFLCPKAIGQGTAHARVAPRGVAGRLAVREQDFLKCGGYDEKYITWQGEDVDIVARLKRMGYSPRFIDQKYLDAIGHSSDVRFKEYPHAKQYETDEEVKRINNEKHTVVNHGMIGCGTVYRNMGGRVDIEPLPARVFGVGFQRTATMSLCEAFKILGFDSFHWETNDTARDIWDQMNEFGKSWTLERYYALCDNPIPLLYKQLDKAYPGSKFILTLRDDAAWLRSVRRWWNPDHNPSRWEWDIWPFPNRIHRACYGRADFDAETFLTRYRRHNAEVIDYFKDRPDDLLVMRMEHNGGWPTLCDFLGAPDPDVPYPHVNRS